MMLGMHRPVGFDYGTAADNEDGGGGADTFWGQCKRLRSSGPTLCSLNTNCVDIPEIWSNAVVGAVKEGIHSAGFSDEAESVVGGTGNPMDVEGEMRGRPRKKELTKRLGNVAVRRSPRLAKVAANADGSAGAVSPPQLLAPQGAQKPDESEVSKNMSIVTCKGEAKWDLTVVESSKWSSKAGEPPEAFASCVPGRGQMQDHLTEARSTKSLGNIAQRRSPQLAKNTAHSNEADPLTDPPELSASSGTPTSDTLGPPHNLCSDVPREQSVGYEFLEPSGSSKMGKSPRSSAKPEFTGAELPKNFFSEARLMEEHDSVSQGQSPQFANLTHQGNERELPVVLALPCFSPHLRTQNSYSEKFSSDASGRFCKEASLTPLAAELVTPLGKVGSCESSGTRKTGYVKALKCSGDDKLRKRPVHVPPRQSPQLTKDTVQGNDCDPSNPSTLPELTGSLANKNILSSVTCKEASPGSDSVEVMGCWDKFEKSPEPWEARKLGSMATETESLEDSTNECRDQSSHLAKDGDCGSGCEWSRELYVPMSITKTKVMKAPSSYSMHWIISGQGSQDIGLARIFMEDLSSTSSTIKDLGKKKEAQCKEIVTRKQVKETLRLFQAICRKLLREEESKAREPCHNNRVDVVALKLIKEKGKCLNVDEHHFGSVPGVEIGDEFHYRAELSIIGLHRNILAGISYAKHDGMYVASSIVFYEGYFDFMERSDVLLYSSSAGSPNYYYRNKGEKHLRDQKLERGNLALKNSMDVQIPIRVVLGLKEPKATDCRISKAKGAVTYVYDGLYLVEKYWSEMGNHGFSIFKFQLRKMSCQRQLAIKEIQNSKWFKLHRRLCTEDISQGQEKIPVVVVNIIDDEHPLPFRYTNKVVYTTWHKLTPPGGCDCTDGCSDSVNCACSVKNGGEIPFNYDGAIVEAKPLVYECGPSCKCPPSCHNRVSQHGIKYPLEVFKTSSMGWGVRSLTSIPSGSFICEYTGEMIKESEANRRTNDDYLFDIGQNYYDKSIWEGLSTCIPGLLQDASSEAVEDECFTIDAANCGNIGRFINHSCSPNLYAQNVLYDHDDKRMPHIMFFAAENISPLEELTYHYNYTIDQVRDLDGNIKKKNCYCGSVECTGRLY